MAMSRHMKVVRFLDDKIQKLERSLHEATPDQWAEYDLLIQTRQELQSLKEDNALYRLNFHEMGKGFEN